MNKFSLQSLIRPEPTVFYSHVRDPVHRKKDYINDLRRNYKELGLDLSRVDKIEAEIPDLETYNTNKKIEETIELVDRVIVQLSYEDNEVKVRLNTSSIETLNYYEQAKNPPLELKIDAYKSLGASEYFINKFIKNENIMKEKGEKIWKNIEKIFEKEQPKIKRSSRKSKKIEEEVEQEEEEEQEEEQEQEQEQEDETLEDGDAVPDDEEIEDNEEILMDDNE